MNLISDLQISLISGGAATSTNGSAGAAAPYGAVNGMANAAEAAAKLATDVEDFIKGVADGIWGAL